MQAIRYTRTNQRIRANEQGQSVSTNPEVVKNVGKLGVMDFAVYGGVILLALGAVYILTRKSKK